MGNIRRTNSKQKIKDAFIYLLKTEGYQKMTVSSITKKAQINRGTFYLNYLDKSDLWREIKETILTDISACLKIEPQNPHFFSEASLKEVINYLIKHQKLLFSILNSDLYPEFIADFYKTLVKIFSKYHNQNKGPLKQPYAYEVVFSGIATIFTLWIRREMRESPEELLKIIKAYRENAPTNILSL